MEKKNIGKVTQVIGAVLDIEFPPGHLPAIYNAIKITNSTISDKQWNLIAEVALHLGENTVRCIAMDSTEGLVRGTQPLHTGDGIAVLVGKVVLGPIFYVVRQPVDEQGP